MRSLTFLVFFVAMTFVGCRAPIPSNDFLWTSPPEELRKANPVDIAVLVPRDATARETLFPGLTPASLPLDQIRKLAYKELIRRHYTPLSIEFIDRAFLGRAVPTEASYSEIRQRCGSDAILSITIKRWNQRHLQRDRVFSIGAELYLIDSLSGKTIWQANADRDVNLSKEPDIERVSLGELRKRAINRFFRKVFDSLPPREIPE